MDVCGVYSIKKLVGLAALLIALGMFLMLITNNRLIGLVMVALLLFIGYNCLYCD